MRRAAKVAVYRAMRQAGIDKDELARRVGVTAEAVDRQFSIHHQTGLDQIEAAVAALERRLVLTVETA